jgi:hypothetical protein
MENIDLTDEQIQKIIKSYKQKMVREKKYYHDVQKNDEQYKIKNRERANKFYHDDKNGYRDKKLQKYQEDKEFITAKSSYYYYKKKNNLDKFKEKSPEKYQLLIDRKFIS